MNEEIERKLDELFKIDIEEIGLSQETIRILRDSGGITTIGDCVSFYTGGKTLSVSSTIQAIMFGEFIEKLRQHDKWELFRAIIKDT